MKKVLTLLLFFNLSSYAGEEPKSVFSEVAKLTLLAEESIKEKPEEKIVEKIFFHFNKGSESFQIGVRKQEPLALLDDILLKDLSKTQLGILTDLMLDVLPKRILKELATEQARITREYLGGIFKGHLLEQAEKAMLASFEELLEKPLEDIERASLKNLIRENLESLTEEKLQSLITKPLTNLANQVTEILKEAKKNYLESLELIENLNREVVDLGQRSKKIVAGVKQESSQNITKIEKIIKSNELRKQNEYMNSEAYRQTPSLFFDFDRLKSQISSELELGKRKENLRWFEEAERHYQKALSFFQGFSKKQQYRGLRRRRQSQTC